MPDPLTQNCSQIALLPPDRRVWKSQAPHARHLNASFHQQKQELKKVEEKLKWQQHHEGSARDASAGRGRWLVGAGTGRQVAPGGTGTGQRQAPCSGGSAFLPASENLPKKFVAFPPVSTSILCQKCLCPGSAAGGRATHLPPRGGCGIPTFPINFGLFFFSFSFFLKFKKPASTVGPVGTLQHLVLVHQEGGLSRKPDRAVPIYQGHFGNLQDKRQS